MDGADAGAPPSNAHIVRFELQVRTLYQSLRARLLRDLAGKKLSYSSLLVLSVVNRRGAATMGEIQRELGLAHSTVTGLVDTLAGRGLVVRASDPADRRVNIVRPTEAGATEVAELRRQRAEHLAAAWPADVSPEELEVCIGVLERLNHSLAAAAAEPGDADAPPGAGKGDQT